MLSKTQIFHISALRPDTVKEADELTSLVESTVTYYLKKSILNEAYTITDIYCNRVNIYTTMEFFPHLPIEKESEYTQLAMSVQQFIGNLVDSYHMLKVRKPNAVLNVECCLLNRTNISISFDLY